jgi:hypothetical protein
VEWFRNVRIVLKGAKKDYVLEETLGDALLKTQLKMRSIFLNLVVVTISMSSVPYLLQWN